jgi:hypothetical protein
MQVKDLIKFCNGEFYIYENAYNEYGNIVDTPCIATHADFRTANKYINQIKNREVNDFTCGHFFINIYVKDLKQ